MRNGSSLELPFVIFLPMRVFVAVNFPQDVRNAIWDACAPLRDAGLPVRWVEPAGLHVTLKFLGQSEAVPGITAVMDAAAGPARPFSLPLGGVGAFPGLERPSVIWVGCDGVPPLELLQNRLEQGLETLGFEIEGRPFRPHVTIGRARKDARPSAFRGLADLAEKIEWQGESLVDSVDLMESRLGGGGSKYQLVHASPLTPG